MDSLIDPMADVALNQLRRREAPMNMARAHAVMEEQGIDGLIMGDPLNLFHALGHLPQLANTKGGQPPTSFALLTCDQMLITADGAEPIHHVGAGVITI